MKLPDVPPQVQLMRVLEVSIPSEKVLTFQQLFEQNGVVVRYRGHDMVRSDGSIVQVHRVRY